MLDVKEYARSELQNRSYKRQIAEQANQIKELKLQLRLCRSENKGVVNTIKKLTSKQNEKIYTIHLRNGDREVRT